MPSRPRTVHRDAKPPSRLERRFADLWRAAGGLLPEAEFRFHPQRRWRADFAHVPSRTLIERNPASGARGRMQQERAMPPPRPMKWGTEAAGRDPRRVKGLG